MINYISTDIPKKSLKKVGRKVVLELFEKNKILSKYQIINKYLYLNSMEKISDDFKDKYKLIEARLSDTNVENIYQNIKNIIPSKLEIETQNILKKTLNAQNVESGLMAKDVKMLIAKKVIKLFNL